LNQERKDFRMSRILSLNLERKDALSLNQERKDFRMSRILSLNLERKDALSLNQERKDFRMSRILSILASFLSWFKDKKRLKSYI